MTKTVHCSQRTGTVSVPASKSIAHRELICAALCDGEATLEIKGASVDIFATIDCLNALGANITTVGDVFKISPITCQSGETAHLYCKESGSTLRFLMPLAAALGKTAVFHTEGLLASRPHSELINELTKHGVSVTSNGNEITVSGRLSSGEYEISGSVSSQFISGLLMALPILDGESRLTVTGVLQSASYVTLTENALKKHEIKFTKNNKTFVINGNQRYCTRSHCAVEKDWSGAAFFVCMGALSEKGITLTGMDLNSEQGDRKVIEAVKQFGAVVTENNDGLTVRKGTLSSAELDASDIPDLIPALSIVAACAHGKTVVKNAERLRFKESDRLKTTAELINALGGKAIETADGLIIEGVENSSGGKITTADHRIAMASAVASLNSHGEIIIDGAQCVEKSYRDFWEDFEGLEIAR